jgi:allantoicase
VEGAAVEGYPDPAELQDADWTPLVPRSPARGDSRNAYPVPESPWITHVRLRQYPDGGVARLRVHGTPIPDPRLLLGTALDLAALANGGAVTGCSNEHYSSPTNLISPGEARVMGEGWETARRRDDGNDWVEITLAGPGTIRLAEIDTSCFVGNAPGWARLTGVGASSQMVELLPRTRLQPDTRHRFRLDPVQDVASVRLDIYPDGGLARLRLWGSLSPAGRAALAARWYGALPAGFARALLVAEAGVTPEEALELTARRPARDGDRVPPALHAALGL